MKISWMWFAAYFAFSSLVSGMPVPDDKSGNGYKWAYASLHALAGNLLLVKKLFRPQLPDSLKGKISQ